MKADTKNMITGFIPPAACNAGRSTAGRAAGFTLVEVVIAMALLILSLAAFTASFVQSRRSAAMADNRLEAIHTARQQMETICSSNYSTIGVSAGTPFSIGAYNGTYKVVITNTPAPVKDITVTVRWVNPLGKVTSTVSLAGSVSSELHQSK